MRAVHMPLLAVAVLAGAILVHGSAAAEPTKCRRTIAKEYGKYAATATKLIQRCKDGVVRKGEPPVLADCQPASLPKLASAAQKLRAKIDGACGGADKSCATPAGNDPLGSIGWSGGACMNFENGGCANAVADCGDIADCLVCIGDAAVEQGLDDLIYDRFLASAFESNSPENRCQAAIGRAGAKFLQTKMKALNRCWDAKLKSKSGFADADPCPDTDPRAGSGTPPALPGDNKTVETIKRAEQKKVDAICKACGGGADADRNGQCDNPPGMPLLGFVNNGFFCPDVTVPPNAVHPGGLDCGSISVVDLASYIECIDCVLEFKADCMTDAGVGDDDPALGIDYPVHCNLGTPVPTVTPTATPTTMATPTVHATVTPGGSCPTRYSFAANGPDADLDLGWTGLDHDNTLPSGARVTAAVAGCASSLTPCGECTLAGPIVNGVGPGLANQRCRGATNGSNGSWISCTSDGDCPGTGNGCTYFFGPPQPTVPGGAIVCVTNEISGPASGTVNVDDGSAAFTLPITSNVHFIGFAFPMVPIIPCPRCEAGICADGERDGEACSVDGTSASFGGLSLDCPPSGASLVGRIRTLVPLTTDTETIVATAASPNCTSFGFTSLKCLCDTCDDAAGTPCAANADCAPGGICGGLRCLVDAPVPGTPCSTEGSTDPICCSEPTCTTGVVGTCGRLGAATKPNSCSNGICDPNTPPDVDSVDEGRCNVSPSDNHCEIDSYRPCTVNSDCPAPGDQCTNSRRECFTANGAIGDDVSASGVPSTTDPTLAGLACASATGSALFNDLYGLPGLERFTLPGTATLN